MATPCNNNLVTMLHMSLEKCSSTFPRFIYVALKNCPEDESMVTAAINDYEQRCDCKKEK